ncbi:F-type H+-transporting ATPase subunit b [Arboricoccus pini]|uniref:ATP synthase subunit b n=1 Tax=Arboricoccus pini TaxID=1963835 RepID=A0A212Q4S8_9PROT|nr:F0F1 ATP synthase subunit B [Arboricoccus pini]SNB54294.1 F-type H+-transporting ATPase subunit b [Arboricoccus pini]
MEYLWLFIAFVIMVVVLWRPVKKGVIGALDARAERIRHDLDEAQRLHEEAKALLARYQQQLSDGEGLAREIRANAEAERQRLEVKLRLEFEGMSERRTQQALDRIAQEEAKALADLRGQAANLAIVATRELIGQNLDKAKANRLMADAIAEVQRKLA